ncbi:hypothetical protein MCOR20_006849 [Pyricularia oryzae]|nr:hypothetical protein MCOR20_006849 [Pyricularia oryzae]
MSRADPGASSITVAVRVRPFTIREAAQLIKNDDGTLFLGDGSLAAVPTPKLKQHGLRSVIKVVDDRCLVFDPPEDNPVQKFSRSVVPCAGKKVKDQVFAFDRIFDDTVSQTEVYEGTTKTLLDSVLDGYNATVFAYGATGCGKTHTITGTAAQPGIIFLTMQELFEKIQERSDEKVTELSLSYLEIYNETIRDLLVPGGSKQGLMLREDSNQGVSVSGLTSLHPKDVQEVMDMIVRGNEYRTVSPTEANATSSRSHAVLQINIAQKDRNADVNEPHTMATLSIIDLAGSERASATKNRGERLIEGANINKSLLALGSCINALCDPRKKNHVPYRNSKLTRLLKFSLGGNCKTVMIVCVSPSSAHFDETQNTLRYANRAKNIQTKVTRNVFNVNRHVKDFLVKIDEQIAMINELKAQQKDAEKIFYAKFRKQLEKRDGVAREGMQRIRSAYENSAQERQDKINNMKRLKGFERRIGQLSAWIAAFDAICDSRSDENGMPDSLAAMRKTAQGVLAELEHSRQHLHQRIERSNWERSIDSALQHSISQLSSGDNVVDNGEVANLTREAELLKANFIREAYREVLDQDRAGDAAAVQVLLTAQFEILASLSSTLQMDEAEAVAHAKTIIHRLLETGISATSHIVKPDGSVMPVERFSPSKRGTPKRKKLSNVHVKPVAAPAFIAMSEAQQEAFASPMKASPRRRKAGAQRKGVSFTPVKKKSPSRRSVRWRDDETEEGTLADFAKTPQKIESSPEATNTPSKADLQPPAIPSYLENADAGSDSSPSLVVPEAASLTSGLAAKPNRFQAGFLSKGRVSSIGGGGSPSSIPYPVNYASSPDSDRPSPLRSLDAGKASNMLSPPPYGMRKSSIPRSPSLLALDENTPLSSSLNARPPPSKVEASSSGSESDTPIDKDNLRLAIHNVKRKDRLSLMSGTAASNAKARRISSTGSAGSSHHRASASYSGPSTSLSSSTNGISRHQRLRRNSSERRRSPPISCSPTASDSDGRLGQSSFARSFTPGQARRMNLGGSLRQESSITSPSGDKGPVKSRRITIGTAAMGSLNGAARKDGAAPRPSVIWR